MKRLTDARGQTFDVFVFAFILAQRLAHPRREWKPEFKQERYPPLDGASCSAVLSVMSLGVKDAKNPAKETNPANGIQ